MRKAKERKETSLERAKCTGKGEDSDTVSNGDSAAVNPSNLDDALEISLLFLLLLAQTALFPPDKMALRTAVLRPFISRQWLAASASAGRPKSRLRVPSPR